MTSHETQHQSWDTPQLTVYGSVAEITQSHPKHKTFGPGDDVLLNNQAILSTLS